MKKRLLIGFLYFLTSSVQLSALFNEKKLLSAIETTNKKRVELLLNKSSLKEENKSLLLKAAQARRKECKKNISLSKSRWDCYTLITGIIGTYSSCSALGGSLLLIGYGCKEFTRTKKGEDLHPFGKMALWGGFGITIISTPVLIGALYLTRKGWRCTTAQNLFTTAKEIEALIEAAPLDDKSTNDTFHENTPL
ncbi:hypothetical protein H0X06_05000 [Candidatus Dependentiae bacterium]|nr:hypothetical protein [Candidatus Dependentiae bacterium]